MPVENVKVSDRDPLTAAEVATDDEVGIVDTSAGESKRMTVEELRKTTAPSRIYATGVAVTDTAALQAALTAASDGDVLELVGDFVVNATLTLTSQDGVVIRGRNCTITQATTLTPTLKVTTSDRFAVSGVHFIGMGNEDPWDGTSWNTVAGVWLSACTNSNVESNVLTNHAGSGIVFQGACSNIRIAKNTIVGMGSPTIQSDDNGSDAGISTGTGTSACASISITDNDISDHAFGIVVSATGSGLTISGNNIHDIPGQHGMYLSGAMDSVVTSNNLSDCEKIGIKYQETAVDVTAAMTISSNTIVRSGADGIGVAGLATSVFYIENLTIIGNNVYDSGQDGINLGSVMHGTCNNNTIRATDRYGIYLAYSSGVVLNNHVRDTEKNGIHVGQFAYPGVLTIDGLELVDCCRNTAAGETTATDRVIAMLNAASSADTIYLGDVHIRYEDYTAKTGTGSLLYAIYGATGTIESTGAIRNSSGVIHRWDGTIGGLGAGVQMAPVAVADGDTAITAADMQSRILTMNSTTTGRAPTVPTGTAINGIVGLSESIDWTFINIGSQVVTVTEATGHTLIGDMTLAASESGSFRTRVSAANTAITYRL